MKWLYKITNNVNAKMYIGVTINPKRRWKQHLRMKTNCKALKSAMKKYGKENFEFTLLCCGEDQYIDDLEVKFIDFYNTVAPNGYNITLGGEGTLYYKWNAEWNKLLGTMTDRDLSEKLGIPFQTIGDRRRSLGIPTYLDNKINTFNENKHLLGVVPDKQLSDICGMSESWIQRQRIEDGKAYRERKTYTITEDHLTYLKNRALKQEDVVEITGLSVAVVNKWRKDNNCKWLDPRINYEFEATADFIKDIKECKLTYKELSKKYKMSKGRVSEWKQKFGISYEKKPITKTEDDRIISGESIKNISKDVGISENRLYERRKDLGNLVKSNNPLMKDPYYSRIVAWDSVCKELAEEWGYPPHQLTAIKREYQKINRRLHPNNLTREEWLYIRYLYESGVSYKGIILNLGLEIKRHDYIQQGLFGQRYTDVTGFSEGEVVFKRLKGG